MYHYREYECDCTISMFINIRDYASNQKEGDWLLVLELKYNPAKSTLKVKDKILK